MSGVSGAVRAGLLAVAIAGLWFGATRVTGSVELAAAHERAGLPESSTVLVDESAVVCPGPQRVGAAGLRDVTGTVTVQAAASPAAALPRAPSPDAASGSAPPAPGGRIDLRSEPAKPLGTSSERGRPAVATVTAPQVVLATASGRLAPGLAATQTWQRTGDDDRGLAVTPCALPSSDVWLVGGGGGPSRTERIIVGNPGSNAVSVTFEVFGSAGPVAGADDRAVSIPPRSRAIVSLDALAPGEVSPAVHVSATGGVVAAVLDDAWIDGATGRGVDDATRSAPPSNDLVIAGLDVDGAASVRLVNPGPDEALVQVRVLTPAGPTQPNDLRAVRVPGGSSRDVPLRMPVGAAGLHLTSDQPIVAGAFVERRASGGTDRMGDFGWAPSTPAISGVAGLLLPKLGPSGANRRLLLAAGRSGATVTVHLLEGEASRSAPVTVKPDSASVTDLGAADQVWVSAESGDVRAAVSISGAVGRVPTFSIASLRSAPVTALSIPVRQVAN